MRRKDNTGSQPGYSPYANYGTTAGVYSERQNDITMGTVAQLEGYCRCPLSENPRCLDCGKRIKIYK